MVAGKDDARHAADGYPACRLEGLRRLVDEERAELLAVEQAVAAAHECAGDDTCLAEELGVNAQFEFRGALLQAVHLLVVVLLAALPAASQVADGLADRP